jgi:hypothetical protein
MNLPRTRRPLPDPWQIGYNFFGIIRTTASTLPYLCLRVLFWYINWPLVLHPWSQMFTRDPFVLLTDLAAINYLPLQMTRIQI